MRAIMVGGGIAGLASAVALARRGWQVEVLERAPGFTEVGAGLSLWPNALRALDGLGVGELVRGRSVLEGQAGIRDAAGRWLSRADTAELERRYGRTAMIHRADLLAVLLAAVPGQALRPGVTVTGVRPDGTVVHSAGESRADLVVGADGVHSVTRTSVWPDGPGPRYAGYTAWRLVTPPVPVTEASESWGRGERFGYAPLPDGRVYCYATANAPEGAADGGLAELRRRLGGWHHPIPALLDAVGPGAVLRHDLYELPPLKAYSCGAVVLAGDGRPRHDPKPRPRGLPGPRRRRRARQRHGQRGRAGRLRPAAAAAHSDDHPPLPPDRRRRPVGVPRGRVPARHRAAAAAPLIPGPLPRSRPGLGRVNGAERVRHRRRVRAQRSLPARAWRNGPPTRPGS